MDNANIDYNSRNVLTAYNETTGLIENLKVDPVTGALLVYGIAADSNTPTPYTRAGIDGNSRNTLSAWNETTNSIEALRCGSDGSLLIIEA
jgi:hypothetical protein